ncbi:hypothetical protein M3914_003316 [Vibrio metschnikovii]|nr:hypothetical protein [Vibrio metschnikovii]
MSEKKWGKPIKTRLSQILDNPVTIERNDSLLSQKSKILANMDNQGPFGKSMSAELFEIKRNSP